RPRGEVPGDAVGERGDGPADQCVLPEGAGRGDAAADAGAWWSHRHARLRRVAGLAAVRLDGRVEGRPGVRGQVLGPRPGPPPDPGELRVGRAPAYDRGEGDPGVRRARGRVAGPGALGLGRDGPG